MSHQNIKQNRELMNSITDDIVKTEWLFCPPRATTLGIHDYDDLLGDMSECSLLKYSKTFKSQSERLQTQVDPSLLTSDERVEYYSALSIAESNYANLELHKQWRSDPGLYLKFAVWGCYIFLLRDFSPLKERMRSMLSRMRQIPDMLNSTKVNITHPSGIFVNTAIGIAQSTAEFFRTVIPGFAEKVPILRIEILAAAEDAASSIEEYGKWLESDVLPRSDNTFAMGEKTYSHLLQAEHYLPYSTRELLKMGESILNDTLDHIKETAALIDPSVSWQDLVSRLKNDHPDPDLLLETYWNEMHKARRFVIDRDLMTIPMDDDLIFHETPEFERSTMPYAAYFPAGPFEKNDTGYFWVTPINPNASDKEREMQLRGHCVHTIPIIALHEGYPGHHLHLNRTRRLKSVLRKQMMSNLMIEGWALYCEQMMHEQGFYTDPRVRFFQLIDLLWRACRVVIDVGLHTQGMTVEEAENMLVEVAHLEKVNAAGEVRRYVMSPQQPMTYMIGMLQLLDLREKMKQRQGPKFSIKSFHDLLLDQGAIPTPLLTKAVLGEKIQPLRNSDMRAREIVLEDGFIQIASEILFTRQPQYLEAGY